jgi:ABC-2 type transport system permease protein
MRSPVFQLILIRFKEFIREPGIVFWSIVFPVAMAWVLGIAFSRRPEIVQTIAMVRNTEASQEKLTYFINSTEPDIDSTTGMVKSYRKVLPNENMGNANFRFIPVSIDSAVLMLKRGQTSIIIKEEKDSLHYLFDPRSPEAKLNYILLSSAINNRQFFSESAEIKPLISPGTRYIDYLIPGLIALGIMNSLLWGVSYTIIEMRSKKLLRRIIATPMKKSHFLFSHFTARLFLATIEASILLFFSWVYFRITLDGSLVAFLMIFLAGNIFFTGISVLISSRTSNSRIGTGLINVVSMPMSILSGIFFSYHNFPEFVIPFIKALPLTILADSIRSIFIEGSGIVDILPGFAILSVSGLIMAYIGLRIFKWY